MLCVAGPLPVPVAYQGPREYCPVGEAGGRVMVVPARAGSQRLGALEHLEVWDVQDPAAPTLVWRGPGGGRAQGSSLALLVAPEGGADWAAVVTEDGAAAVVGEDGATRWRGVLDGAAEASSRGLSQASIACDGLLVAYDSGNARVRAWRLPVAGNGHAGAGAVRELPWAAGLRGEQGHVAALAVAADGRTVVFRREHGDGMRAVALDHEGRLGGEQAAAHLTDDVDDDDDDDDDLGTEPATAVCTAAGMFASCDWRGDTVTLAPLRGGPPGARVVPLEPRNDEDLREDEWRVGAAPVSGGDGGLVAAAANNEVVVVSVAEARQVAHVSGAAGEPRLRDVRVVGGGAGGHGCYTLVAWFDDPAVPAELWTVDVRGGGRGVEMYQRRGGALVRGGE